MVERSAERLLLSSATAAGRASREINKIYIDTCRSIFLYSGRYVQRWSPQD